MKKVIINKKQSWIFPTAFFYKERKLESDKQVTVLNEYVWEVMHSNADSWNWGSSNIDLEHGDVPLLIRTDLDSHANILVVGKM